MRADGAAPYRTNSGGDRQANATLHRIVIVRLRHDDRTKEFMCRRTPIHVNEVIVTRQNQDTRSITLAPLFTGLRGW